MNNIDSTQLESIRTERQKVYGDPRENHRGIAQMWSPLLQPHWERIKNGDPVPEHVVALLMAALKLDRMRLRFHQDNYDDIFNYLQFASEWQKDYSNDLSNAPAVQSQAQATSQVSDMSAHVAQQTGGRPTVYLAGPMRGYPKYNFPEFDRVRDDAIRRDWKVISPADLDRASGFHEDTQAGVTPSLTREFVVRDINALLSLRPENGDAVVMLRGWERSVGATAEFFMARWLGLPIMTDRLFDLRSVDWTEVAKSVGKFLDDMATTGAINAA